MGCGKTRYTHEKAAIRAAMGASRRSGLGLRVYRCPDCRGWHLTKKKSWVDAPTKHHTATPGSGPHCLCGQCAWMDEYPNDGMEPVAHAMWAS